jgi:hypothetical protein
MSNDAAVEHFFCEQRHALLVATHTIHAETPRQPLCNYRKSVGLCSGHAMHCSAVHAELSSAEQCKVHSTQCKAAQCSTMAVQWQYSAIQYSTCTVNFTIEQCSATYGTVKSQRTWCVHNVHLPQQRSRQPPHKQPISLLHQLRLLLGGGGVSVPAAVKRQSNTSQTPVKHAWKTVDQGHCVALSVTCSYAKVPVTTDSMLNRSPCGQVQKT